MKMELRVNPTSIETSEDGSLKVSGYVNRTNQFSNMLGRESRFKEVIKPGVWQSAIDKAKEIHFYAEHDKNKILASTRNGSLELREDDQGLYMTAQISPTSWGKDYYQLIKDGILQNMSFGFRAVKDSWRNMGDYFERTINDLELFEVSVVRDPAYAQSSISARGIDLVEDEVPAEELKVDESEKRDYDGTAQMLQQLIQMVSTLMPQQVSKPVSDPAAELQEGGSESEVSGDPDMGAEGSISDTALISDSDGEDDSDGDGDLGVPDVDSDEDPGMDTDNDIEGEEQSDADDVLNAVQKIRDFINQFK